MTDDSDTPDTDDAQHATDAALDAAAIVSTYKILGQLTDSDGVGVLGQNDAQSGTPIGVKGAVPNNSDGYGLETPDDARVGGTLDSTGVFQAAADGDVGLRVYPTTEDSGYVFGGNVIGGYENNGVQNDAVGATISGGGWSGSITVNGESRANTNEVTSGLGTIGGGYNNRAGAVATVGGGRGNSATAKRATVGGGQENVASGSHATVGGGLKNKVLGDTATAAGGRSQYVTGAHASVGGGYGNWAYGGMDTIGGGYSNETATSGTSDTFYATVPGGRQNVARGKDSFAAGREAQALADGTFVWGDGSSATVQSQTANEVVFQAGGGVVLWSSSDFSSKVQLNPGDASWTQGSSRTIKSDVSPVDPEDVLRGVEDIEVSTWEYDSRRGVTHMGPMAEDFQATFDLGEDEQQISAVDADGVALAAIKGLAGRLDDAREELADVRADLREARKERDRRDDRIDDLERENEVLRERLTAVEAHLDLDAGGTPAPTDD